MKIKKKKLNKKILKKLKIQNISEKFNILLLTYINLFKIDLQMFYQPF